MTAPPAPSIPLVDLIAQHRALERELSEAFARTLDSGQFVKGPQLEAFETELAEACAVPHAVGVGNGTDALELALRAAGIGPGHEVVTVANTFAATAEAIVAVGADPVFVDVGPDDQLIAVDRVEQAVNARTAAIVPVHLFGRPCDMPALRTICDRHGLALIADAAQAIGSNGSDGPVTAEADLSTLSFYPGKTLGALGDGGAVVTPHPALAEEVRRLADHGRRSKYVHEVVGRNSRLDAMQAALLSVKLAHLPEWVLRRRRIAQRYDRAFDDLPGVVAWRHEDSGSAVHLYVVEVEDRDRLRDDLARAGVHTGVHYPEPLHLQPAFRRWRRSALPHTEALARRIVSLPVYPEMGESEVERVIAAVTGAQGRRPPRRAR